MSRFVQLQGDFIRASAAFFPNENILYIFPKVKLYHMYMFMKIAALLFGLRVMDITFLLLK